MAGITGQQNGPETTGNVQAVAMSKFTAVTGMSSWQHSEMDLKQQQGWHRNVDLRQETRTSDHGDEDCLLPRHYILFGMLSLLVNGKKIEKGKPNLHHIGPYCWCGRRRGGGKIQ